MDRMGEIFPHYWNRYRNWQYYLKICRNMVKVSSRANEILYHPIAISEFRRDNWEFTLSYMHCDIAPKFDFPIVIKNDDDFIFPRKTVVADNGLIEFAETEPEYLLRCVDLCHREIDRCVELYDAHRLVFKRFLP